MTEVVSGGSTCVVVKPFDIACVNPAFCRMFCLKRGSFNLTLVKLRNSFVESNSYFLSYVLFRILILSHDKIVSPFNFILKDMITCVFAYKLPHIVASASFIFNGKPTPNMIRSATLLLCNPLGATLESQTAYRVDFFVCQF